MGTWTKSIDYGEGSAAARGFPDMPDWFGGNSDFSNIASGLKAAGLSDEDVAALMGGNWMRFFSENFCKAQISMLLVAE